MKNDPIIDELHRIRYAYAAQFNFDLDALFADLKQKEKNSGRRYLVQPPRFLNTQAEEQIVPFR